MHRRQFIETLSCGAHILGLSCFAPGLMRQAFSPQDTDRVVTQEKWGRLERVHEGVWVHISTPFESRDFTTVCNGGIIAGRDRVLAVESFMSPAGAKWIAELAKQLTGRWPTDVVSTHYHGDHTGGHKGYLTEQSIPQMWLTPSTRQAAEKSFRERNQEDNGFGTIRELSEDEPTKLELGGRQVFIVPRSGHTNSDVTIELVDPKVIWCGDLFFNRMFPNYSDAIPSRLNAYVKQLLQSDDVTYVPGHGGIADLAAVRKYQAVLEFVEQSARDAFQAGKSVDEAAGEFELPESLKEWFIWSPDNAKRGFNAWHRELQE